MTEAKFPSLKFQQLQQQMTQVIRCPEAAYQGTAYGGLPIESRRLAVYRSLFLNNITDLMHNVFPVMSEILGEEKVETLAGLFLQQYGSQTPLFHELGQEFLQFLQQWQTTEAAQGYPPWLFELAHYEWVELALMVAEETCDFNAHQHSKKLASLCQEQTLLQLCETAWPLGYAWPVDEISKDHAQHLQPKATFFLVYRTPEGQVAFMKVTAALFQWLQVLWQSEEPLTFEQLGQQVFSAETVENSEHCEKLFAQAWQAMQGLIQEPGIFKLA